VKQEVTYAMAQSRHADTLWYFAYGSNMHRSIFVERRQMHPLEVRQGCLEHYRLCFNLPIGPGERGVANLEPEGGTRTYGVLYLLTPSDSDRLDRTGGVDRGVYRRTPVEVFTEEEEWIQAFTYLSSLNQPIRKPSARYLGLLIAGARQHRLPAEYVQFLERFELARDERQDKVLA
jgi:cation transport regulator ChaC